MVCKKVVEMYIENKTIEETGLEIGKTYWMYMVSSGMGSTCRHQITIKDFREHESYAQYKNLLSIVFREKGKKKDSELFLKRSMLFLETEIPLAIDTDYDRISMNACINFVTNFPESLRDSILKFNRYKFSNLGIITYNLRVLFKDKADMSHAVIRRMIEDEGIHR